MYGVATVDDAVPRTDVCCALLRIRRFLYHGRSHPATYYPCLRTYSPVFAQADEPRAHALTQVASERSRAPPCDLRL